MSPSNTYTMERTVLDTDVDFSRRLKLSAMFQYFQDAAAAHAASLGASVERLYSELNVAWILMKIRVEIEKYPMLTKQVFVDTWPQEPKALYERDYTIRNDRGEILVRSNSTWVIMNLQTREIKRDKFLDYFNLKMRKDRAIGIDKKRQRRIQGAIKTYEKTVRYSDIDYNHHVNNARYVDYIMDAITFEEHKAKTIRALEVYYVNEMDPDSDLVISRRTIEPEEGDVPEVQKLYVEGVRKNDDKVVFYAIVEAE